MGPASVVLTTAIHNLKTQKAINIQFLFHTKRKKKSRRLDLDIHPVHSSYSSTILTFAAVHVPYREYLSILNTHYSLSNSANLKIRNKTQSNDSIDLYPVRPTSLHNGLPPLAIPLPTSGSVLRVSGSHFSTSRNADDVS